MASAAAIGSTRGGKKQTPFRNAEPTSCGFRGKLTLHASSPIPRGHRI